MAASFIRTAFQGSLLLLDVSCVIASDKLLLPRAQKDLSRSSLMATAAGKLVRVSTHRDFALQEFGQDRINHSIQQYVFDDAMKPTKKSTNTTAQSTNTQQQQALARNSTSATTQSTNTQQQQVAPAKNSTSA